VNAHTTRYHIVEEVPLSELSIFQWKGYITDNEWNYTMLYMYTNMNKIQLYFDISDKTYWK
jgi:hypothetical protein